MHIYLRRENARRDSLTAAKGLTLDSYTSDMKEAEREKGDNATVSHGPPLSYWVGSVLTAAVLPLHDLECGANRLGSTVMHVDFADFWISFGCRVIAMVCGEWDVVYSLFFFSSSYFLPPFLWLRPYASMVVPFQKQKRAIFRRYGLFRVLAFATYSDDSWQNAVVELPKRTREERKSVVER